MHDRKLFFLIFVIVFTIFLFTSDAHRYTIDEDYAHDQAKRIVTQEPNPLYVQGESSLFFQYPEIFPTDAPWFHKGPICHNAILCYPISIGYSLTEVPFIFINHNFHVITNDNVVWTAEDFDDPHYLWWRNSLDPDFTFLELFYGPTLCALSVAVFFLVCRTFDFNSKTSVILAILYGFTTTIWAYSNTSLSNVPVTLFALLGFLFFRKYQKNKHIINLILCSSSLGFGFLVRPDAVLFIIPLFLFLLYELRKQNQKIKKFFSFVIPAGISYLIYLIIDYVRSHSPIISTAIDAPGSLIPGTYLTYNGISGLLLSPGVGLLIFAPILFTIFFAFPDFYKRNKVECLLFLSFTIVFLIYYGSNPHWHGLVAWGARYLLPVVPFLLLPLGASIEKRKNMILKISLLVTAFFGFLFNLVYVVQDVSWFVWCRPGCETGLFSLGNVQTDLYIHDSVMWSFKFSQLTHSIINAFTALQPDIFLLKVLGAPLFGSIFVIIIAPLTYILLSLLKNKKHSQKEIY